MTCITIPPIKLSDCAAINSVLLVIKASKSQNTCIIANEEELFTTVVYD